MIRAGVIGASGYAGIELVRFLLAHPGFELSIAVSDSHAGSPVSSLYPALAGSCDLEFSALDTTQVAACCDLVFLAVPHTASLALTPGFLEAGLTVIDLSADYRLHAADAYRRWYGVAHSSPALLEEAVYGLPEFSRGALVALAAAPTKLVACAGCYPTASTLAALPALTHGLYAGGTVISDCLSGVSGAGRKPSDTAMFCAAEESACAYGVTTHRHTPEIAQTYRAAAGTEVPFIFTPHLVPMKRGLLSTVYIPLHEGVGLVDVCSVYGDSYINEPFVTLLEPGNMPKTASVSGTNNAQVSLAVDAETNMLIASCAIDNLGKGAAGQAVQCANIVCGFDEADGLITTLPAVV